MIKLSVIIPTRNRAPTLERALASFAGQTFPKDEFEVIVVDNGSTDRTAEVCARTSSLFIHFRRLYDEHPGLHVGRNLGMECAQAEILVYGDDDIEASPEWLESIYQSFANPDVVLVGGKNLPVFEAPPPEWIEHLWAPNASGERICGPLSILDLGDNPRRISPYKVYGCNFSIRKPVLLAAGGVHPDGMPKELIRFRGDGETHVSRFIDNQGLVAFYHPGASVGHLVSRERLTVEYFCQRSFNQGVSNSFAEFREKKVTGRRNRGVLRFLRGLITWVRLRNAAYPVARMVKATHLGYNFHQREYRRDPMLRDWVHRVNFLGGNSYIKQSGSA